MASLRFRAGCSGTHSQVSAIAISSALRVASFSFAAISRASSA